MVITTQSSLSLEMSLEDFLKFPETKPASEYINGKIEVKPMPQGEHSLLQSELCTKINEVGKSKKIAYVFPELRCSFGGRSLLLDVAVFRWERVIITEKGRVANRFNIYPDWCIEILSPDQSLTKVLDNLLHCSECGTQLGWLINPEENIILIVKENQRVKLVKEDEVLPVLSGIDLTLKVKEVFSWLNWQV